MQVRIEAKQNRLPAQASRPYLEAVDLSFESGRFTVVTGDSDCTLGNLFYLSLGLLPVDRGSVQIDGKPVDDLTAGGVSVRSGRVAIVDGRSAPLHEKTLAAFVAEGTDGDEEAARGWLRKVGVDEIFHDTLPGSADDRDGEEPVLFGFDPDRRVFFGLLAREPGRVDDFLVAQRIPMSLLYPLQERNDSAQGGGLR